jgi:hypothetical protein
VQVSLSTYPVEQKIISESWHSYPKRLFEKDLGCAQSGWLTKVA